MMECRECIKSPGGHRRYSVSSLEQIKSGSITTILYARVSTSSHSYDLKTQIEYARKSLPFVLSVGADIGSGLNFKRKKFILKEERVASCEVTNISRCTQR